MKIQEFFYVPPWAKYYNPIAGGIFFSEVGYCFVELVNQHKKRPSSLWTATECKHYAKMEDTRRPVTTSLENK